jgi:hypothetical protein
MSLLDSISLVTCSATDNWWLSLYAVRIYKFLNTIFGSIPEHFAATPIFSGFTEAEVFLE